MATKKINHKQHRHNYACEIMCHESNAMVQRVGERCRAEGLFYLPVHDGFMTLPDHYDRVCEIVTETFVEVTDATPRIRMK
jgi:hypothetical protein